MVRPHPAHPLQQPPHLPVVTSVDDLVAVATPLASAFLRYSGGPRADAATTPRDPESGSVLPGLAVLPLAPEPWWVRPAREWVARQVCQFADLWGGAWTGWVLTGRTCGRGPDGEPLVTDVRPVALLGEACLDDATRVYSAAFAHHAARW